MVRAHSCQLDHSAVSIVTGGLGRPRLSAEPAPGAGLITLARHCSVRPAPPAIRSADKRSAAPHPTQSPRSVPPSASEISLVRLRAARVCGVIRLVINQNNLAAPAGEASVEESMFFRKKDADLAPSAAGKTGAGATDSGSSVSVSMTVNGKAVSADVEARTLLVQFLRENLRLTGTHVGCDTSQCGACVVHVDGKRSSPAPCSRCQARRRQGHHHRGPGQGRQAASDAGGLPRASRAAVRLLHAGHDDGGDRPGEPANARSSTKRRSAHELEGNLCRCTGYHNIVKAILAAGAAMKSNGGVP